MVNRVGFADGTALKKVAVTGGPPVTICSLDANPRGATWSPDGTILFATNNPATGLFRVSDGGGEPEVVTTPDRERGDVDHQWPELLPGGEAALFTITSTGGTESRQVAVLDLRTGEQKVVVRGWSHAHYVESGHLVYASTGTLRAVPFDLQRLETTGTPVPVVPEVLTTGAGAADFDVARNGTLVYVSGDLAAVARTLVWLDRQGVEQAVGADARAYRYPRLSPDGQRVAVTIEGSGNHNWIYDLRRGTTTRLTFEGSPNLMGTWMPDGTRIAFGSSVSGIYNIFWQPADGSGPAERLNTSQNVSIPTSSSPDGRTLAFLAIRPDTGYDISVLRLSDPQHETMPFLQTRFSESAAAFSPDGHWLAYASDESGRTEVYVQPYPGPGGKWQNFDRRRRRAGVEPERARVILPQRREDDGR